MPAVILVDNQRTYRESLAHILGMEAGLSVVAQAGTLAEARLLLDQADVAVVNDTLPDGPGHALIADLRAIRSRCAVLILTDSASRLVQARAFVAGAAGVLATSCSVSEIVAAIQRLAAGESIHRQAEISEFLQLAANDRARADRARELARDLTPREREVLQTLAEGLSEKEIASTLGISVRTAHNHVANILGKMHVDSRLRAVITALRYDLVSISSAD